MSRFRSGNSVPDILYHYHRTLHDFLLFPSMSSTVLRPSIFTLLHDLGFWIFPLVPLNKM